MSDPTEDIKNVIDKIEIDTALWSKSGDQNISQTVAVTALLAWPVEVLAQAVSDSMPHESAGIHVSYKKEDDTWYSAQAVRSAFPNIINIVRKDEACEEKYRWLYSGMMSSIKDVKFAEVPPLEVPANDQGS